MTPRHMPSDAGLANAISSPPDDRQDHPAPRWRGGVTPYEVGDAGRAPSRVVATPDVSHWRRRDTVLDGVLIADPAGRPALHLRAASLRGLSHRHYGRVRQDEYAFQATPDGRFLVISVADGVGAGPLSHLAAQWATRSGVHRLCGLLTHTEPSALPWPSLITSVAEEIERRGRDRLAHDQELAGPELTTRQVAEQLATTVLYTVIDLRDGADGYPTHLLSVGDTSAWVLGREGVWRAQQPVKNADAEIYSSAVSALPLVPVTPPETVHTSVRPGEALVVMSDGVGDPLGDGSGEVGRFLAEAWRQPPMDLDFAAQVGFHRRSFDDDRTAVAVWPVTRS